MGTGLLPCHIYLTRALGGESPGADGAAVSSGHPMPLLTSKIMRRFLMERQAKSSRLAQMRKIAPATERGRSRTLPPSLPDFTIHWPFGARPVMMPTW